MLFKDVAIQLRFKSSRCPVSYIFCQCCPKYSRRSSVNTSWLWNPDYSLIRSDLGFWMSRTAGSSYCLHCCRRHFYRLDMRILWKRKPNTQWGLWRLRILGWWWYITNHGTTPNYETLQYTWGSAACAANNLACPCTLYFVKLVKHPNRNNQTTADIRNELVHYVLKKKELFWEWIT